jgi:hypothetical protein
MTAITAKRPVDNAEHEDIGWGFAARWILATLLDLFAGLVAFVAVGVMAGDVIDGLPGFVFGAVLGLVFVASFGVTQWRVLRRYLRPVAAWIGATFVVGGVIIFGLMNGSELDIPLTTKLGHGLVLGASLGLAQWSILRGKLDKAKLWIAISAVAWVAAELVGVALTGLVGAPFNLLGLFLVGGVVPGIGMAWLLRRTAGGPRRPPRQVPAGGPPGRENH